MAYEPMLDSKPHTNVYGEHEYKVRVTLGASTAFSYRAKDITVTRPSATTLKLSLPKAYAEITDYKVGRKAAASVAGLEYIITTDNSTDASDPYVTLTSIVTGGTATAGASGDVLFINIAFSCDFLNDRFAGSG